MEIKDMSQLMCDHKDRNLQFRSNEDMEEMEIVISCNDCGANAIRIESPSTEQLEELRDKVYSYLMNDLTEMEEVQSKMYSFAIQVTRVAEPEFSDGVQLKFDKAIEEYKEFAKKADAIRREPMVVSELSSETKSRIVGPQLKEVERQLGIDVDLDKILDQFMTPTDLLRSLIGLTLEDFSDFIGERLQEERRISLACATMARMVFEDLQRGRITFQENNHEWALLQMPLFCYIERVPTFPSPECIYEEPRK